MKNYLTLICLCCLFAQAGFAQILGCTDPAAVNYNAQAVENDNSCCYTNWVTISSETQADASISSPFIYEDLAMPGTTELCLESGCYYLYVTPLSEPLGNITITINGVVTEYTADYFWIGYIQFSVGENVGGCMDSAACNYDPTATCSDNSCFYNCYGCTNPQALNYDATALYDDGSCCTNPETWYTIESNEPGYVYVYDSNGSYEYIHFPTQGGFCSVASCVSLYFTFESANTVATVTTPTGEVYTVTIDNVLAQQELTISAGGQVGCIDYNACNYDPTAECGGINLCDYSCVGCTDPTAPNYNPDATVDNGTCCTNEHWRTFTASEAGFLTLYSANGSSEHFNLNANEATNACVEDGCYYLLFTPATFSGEATVTVSGQGAVYFSQVVTYAEEVFVSINTINGCTDPGACNYNPLANCGYSSECTYHCFGCTDPEADNFSPDATIDNGTCCYNTVTFQCSDPSALVYITASFMYNQYYYVGADNTVCLPRGCFSGTIYTNGAGIFDYSFIDADGNVVASGTSQSTYYENFTLNLDGVVGCMDYYACNFDPAATCFDVSMCDYSCRGCMDPTASNFNENATIDDGTCCYGTWYTVEAPADVYWNAYDAQYYGGSGMGNGGFCMSNSCFNFNAINYYNPVNSLFVITIYAADGSVFYTSNSDEFGSLNVTFEQGGISGCTDPTACNYNPDATCGLWSDCDYSCQGCTDPTAPNYDADATIDNGTCCYANWYTIELSSPSYWSVSNSNYTLYAGGYSPEQTGFCFDGTSCFQLSIYSYDGSPVDYILRNSNGVVVAQGTYSFEQYNWWGVSISQGNEVAGCTDANACNYNQEATCDNGTCNYYCGGCMDAAALNYNPFAVFDDGTCFYDMEAPGIQMNVETDELNDVYYVRMEVFTLGNGAPYIAQNSVNTQMMMLNETGTYMAGPFSCDQDVMISLNSLSLGMTDFMVSDPLQGPCGISNSVDELENNTLNVYPNPNDGRFFIKGLQGEKALVSVFDMTGREVKQFNVNVNASATECDLSDLTNGVYNVRVMQNGKALNARVIKK